MIFLLLPLIAQAEYLGDLSANPFGPNSTANPLGGGNPLSPNSVTNPLGPYGNPLSPNSAINPLSIETPRLYDQGGNYRGKLNTNQFDPDSISNPMDGMGILSSPDSIMASVGCPNQAGDCNF